MFWYCCYFSSFPSSSSSSFFLLVFLFGGKRTTLTRGDNEVRARTYILQLYACVCVCVWHYSLLQQQQEPQKLWSSSLLSIILCCELNFLFLLLLLLLLLLILHRFVFVVVKTLICIFVTEAARVRNRFDFCLIFFKFSILFDSNKPLLMLAKCFKRTVDRTRPESPCRDSQSYFHNSILDYITKYTKRINIPEKW